MERLLRRCREEAGRGPQPSAGLLEAQSVPSGRLGPREQVGVDGGKRIRGRKRHLLCDINGLPIAVGVTSAQPRDSRGGQTLLETAKPQLTRRTKVFADASYSGLVGTCRRGNSASPSTSGDVPEGTHWFVPLQPLWRVKRTLAWLGRNRRLGYDYEATVTSSRTFVHTATVAFMLNRLHPKPMSHSRSSEGLFTGSETVPASLSRWCRASRVVTACRTAGADWSGGQHEDSGMAAGRVAPGICHAAV